MALSYQWYRNGSPILGATSATYTKTAATGDTGTYYCKVSNAFGTTDSNSATVVVRDVEPAYWWVNSTTGITETDGKVSEWLSKYGDGKGFEQSNADYRPALYPAGAINGITPVRFTLDSLGRKPAMSDLSSSACSVSALFTLNAYGGTHENVMRVGNIGFALRYIETNELRLLVTQFSSDTGYVVSEGQTCVITVTLSGSGGTPKVYVNKQLVYTGTWHAGSSFQSTLGSGENQIYPAHDISMFEAAAWDKELTQEQINTLVDYMNHKYGLSLS